MDIKDTVVIQHSLHYYRNHEISKKVAKLMIYTFQ